VSAPFVGLDASKCHTWTVWRICDGQTFAAQCSQIVVCYEVWINILAIDIRLFDKSFQMKATIFFRVPDTLFNVLNPKLFDEKDQMRLRRPRLSQRTAAVFGPIHSPSICGHKHKKCVISV
jgi:hypothetical protein